MVLAGIGIPFRGLPGRNAHAGRNAGHVGRNPPPQIVAAKRFNRNKTA
jgi:hypothetical protein